MIEYLLKLLYRYRVIDLASSLSLSFLHGYLRIRYSFSEPHLPPLQRVVRKKKNSLLVEHPEWRKVEGNERGKARPSCMPVNWSGERCWIGGPVVGVNVWNCFSRGHQEPFGVTWSRRALSGKAGGRGGGVKEALEINSQSLLPPPPWSGRSALYLPSTSLFLDPDLSARSGRPSPPIRPLVRSQTSRYECHLTSSIKGSHVSSERISQVPPYEYFYIIFYSRWSDVHTHTRDVPRISKYIVRINSHPRWCFSAKKHRK